ncbi:alanine--tRNA ligase [Candidatus Campbellbacteria bacterium CG22_combo_CG10-13_8_21_14_all_36_13]|uniref:Alanine--tRNA ligase n=1 Tax=Candidatus Campbellbacteria bacterium CG22_combo_CG10-13_8_21_14_all_36_13 TaxID=1974529 RepID=A0A2H0DYK2_9BACT|nr:MAG: alanine--tRNA ligase [Candidatus Campbellbacteria bacterium CG22_combo_CG10-13_8_21_14_all_36_13]
MKSEEIRQKFLKYFEANGHTIIPSASLVPQDNSSSLFTIAGMQPLTQYFLGSKHPAGVRLVNSQKCVRTNDIDEVGDKTHLTFFEMFGIWSLGDYFKEQSIKQSFDFITSKDHLGLDPSRLYATVFAGDPELAPRDNESFEIWKSVGMPEGRIYFLGAKDNWWSAGDNGPCGPDTEIFYDITEEGIGDLSHEEFVKATDNQKIVEIWNNVFMEYLKKDGKVVGKLEKQNVDTGAGFERLTTVLQKADSIFDTDLFSGLMAEASKFTSNTRSQRIISDHFRSAVFMISDGIVPSNTDRGYILRRLLRRAVTKTDKKKIEVAEIDSMVEVVVNKYEYAYPNLKTEEENIKKVIKEELEKFELTIEKGFKEFEKMKSKGVDGKEAFVLFSTYGFPLELTLELAKDEGIEVDVNAFYEEEKKHQEASRTASAGMFKGGLQDHSEMSVKYHTATHLLLAALREILGAHVEQRGSNINDERLRLDFSHGEKMTDEEKQRVEDWVNGAVMKDLGVSWSEVSVKEAKENGAVGIFEDKYGDTVKVYSVGEGDNVVSMEICGGPHVERTGDMGKFKILKEEAVSQGVRRIKAVLE